MICLLRSTTPLQILRKGAILLEKRYLKEGALDGCSSGTWGLLEQGIRGLVQKKQRTGILEVTGAKKKTEYFRGNKKKCLSFAKNICIEAVRKTIIIINSG